MTGMRRLILLIVAALSIAPALAQPARAEEPAPALAFTTVPGWGDDEDLAGKASGVKPDDCYVAVYIKVAEHWWTKPNFESARVPIGADGAWTADITTGSDDAFATEIAAFVLPNDVPPPRADYAAELPAELAKRALASKRVTREKPASPSPAAASAAAPAAPQEKRTLQFAGRNWQVKASDRPVGPGPNRFSGRKEDIWVDDAGLHLTVSRQEKNWFCTEAILQESLGYGTYAFITNSRIDMYDPQIVGGLFTWDNDAPPPNREIDFEFARWGSTLDPTNAQFVVQPCLKPGNMLRYRIELDDKSAELTLVFVWSPGEVRFTTARGAHPPDAIPEDKVVFTWTYKGAGVPQPGSEKVHLNLWIADGRPPKNSGPFELVVKDFKYAPPAK